MSTYISLADAHGRGWLEQVDPRLKLAWVAFISTLSVVVDTTPALLMLFAVAMLGVSGLTMRRGSWLLVGGLLLAIAWGSLLSQALFYAAEPRTKLFTLVPPATMFGWPWSGLHVYQEGAVYGLTQSLRMLAMTSAGLSVCLSTSPERLMAALARLQVPGPLAYLVVVALRFLPLMLVEMATVRQARRLRGYSPLGIRLAWSPRAWAHWTRLEVALLLPVIASTLRRAQALARSVSARGFDPAARRTFYPPLRLRRIERVALVAMGSVFLAIVSIKIVYWLNVAEQSSGAGLTSVYDFARDWL